MHWNILPVEKISILKARSLLAKHEVKQIHQILQRTHILRIYTVLVTSSILSMKVSMEEEGACTEQALSSTRKNVVRTVHAMQSCFFVIQFVSQFVIPFAAVVLAFLAAGFEAPLPSASCLVLVAAFLALFFFFLEGPPGMV